MLLGIALLFIFLYQPPKLIGFFGRLQASSRFQTSSLWSRTLINFEPCLMVKMIIIVFVFGHLFAIICLVNCLIRRPIVFGLTEPLILVICSLVLTFWLFNHFRSCQTDILGWSLIWLVGGLIGRPVVGSINLNLNWLMFFVLFLQSFSWAVQNKIIFLNNYTSISDLY